MKTKTEKLKDMLGKKVSFIHFGSSTPLIGTVVGVYLEHPCQKKELKVFSQQLKYGQGGYVYVLVSEVKEIKTVNAYAYRRNGDVGEIKWLSTDHLAVSDGTWERAEELDMEKEYVDKGGF